VLSSIAFSSLAFAQDALDLNAPPVGKAANTFMIRLRAIGVIPLDSSSSVSTLGVSATAQAAPEIDFS